MQKGFVAAAALVLALAGAAHAQGAPPSASKQDEIATLRIDKGSAMTSRGGEFSAAANGQRLIEDERIMVPEGAEVTVIYDNKCREDHDDPGVYDVDHARCAVVWWDWHAAGIITAGTLIGAGILANMDDDPDSGGGHPPVPVSR